MKQIKMIDQSKYVCIRCMGSKKITLKGYDGIHEIRCPVCNVVHNKYVYGCYKGNGKPIVTDDQSPDVLLLDHKDVPRTTEQRLRKV